jgi:hypothetical protein
VICKFAIHLALAITIQSNLISCLTHYRKTIGLRNTYSKYYDFNRAADWDYIMSHLDNADFNCLITSDQPVEFISEKFYWISYECISLHAPLRVNHKKQMASNIPLSRVEHYIRRPLRGASFANFVRLSCAACTIIWLLSVV